MTSLFIYLFILAEVLPSLGLTSNGTEGAAVGHQPGVLKCKRRLQKRSENFGTHEPTAAEEEPTRDCQIFPVISEPPPTAKPPIIVQPQTSLPLPPVQPQQPQNVPGGHQVPHNGMAIIPNVPNNGNGRPTVYQFNGNYGTLNGGRWVPTYGYTPPRGTMIAVGVVPGAVAGLSPNPSFMNRVIPATGNATPNLAIPGRTQVLPGRLIPVGGFYPATWGQFIPTRTQAQASPGRNEISPSNGAVPKCPQKPRRPLNRWVLQTLPRRGHVPFQQRAIQGTGFASGSSEEYRKGK
ncbi:leukocyte receptor cluster member 8 homolog [Erpetoichthys calabaricus]|uniref:leukocyte receptor cluster member 8 homolog n=1 Tax=Erpetoichthys calabaricus TaxID=27687 RepID=UPI002234BCF5|nr:leukocyte receptor cluster member 8 homolog [Erpetoichthys calabaricus]